MSGTVRVRLLGRLGVEHEGRWLDGSRLPGRQGRVVFAYLALCHHPVSRDELADLVWPDALTASWERDLSAVVSKVRAALYSIDLGSTLHGAFGCYELQLPAGSSIDVEDAVRFVEDAESAWRTGDRNRSLAAAATAANLARRPLLPAERGQWNERRRDELRATLLRALDVLVDGLAGGLFEHDALRYAKQAIALDRYRETGYVRLMRLHMSRGNRAEALWVYEQCRDILARDLGVNSHRRQKPLTDRCSLPDSGRVALEWLRGQPIRRPTSDSLAGRLGGRPRQSARSAARRLQARPRPRGGATRHPGGSAAAR